MGTLSFLTLSTHDSNSQINKIKNNVTAVIINSKSGINELNNNNTNLSITGNNTNIISQNGERVDTNIWPQTILEETSTIYNLTPPRSTSDHTTNASFNTTNTLIPASPNLIPPNQQLLPITFPTHRVPSNIVTTVPDLPSTPVSSLIIPTKLHSHPRTIPPDDGHTAP